MESFLPAQSSENTEELKIVWNSEKITKVLNAIEDGYKPKYNPFYEGNIRYKKANIVYEYSDFEMSELKKCATDIVYFANTYCFVMTDEGVQQIKLRPYQEMMLRSYQNNRFNIALASRQIGKTIVASIFNAHYICFHFDRNLLFLSNKGDTTKEIIEKTKVILENLPFFIKPGVIKNDVFNMKFDNGCRMIGQNTTKSAGIGFTIHVLYLDEFAHIPHTFVKSFYENAYPTISSSKVSKIIITSTPNGFNKFYEIYNEAIEGKNEFTPITINWWDVPGRDEAWKEREIGNLGSIEAFNEQYGNQFVSSSSLLLGTGELKKLDSWRKEFVHHKFEELDEIGLHYLELKWDPDFDLDNLTDGSKFFLFSVDIGEGVKNDYSIINIFEIDAIDPKMHKYIENPTSILDFFQLKQIGLFRSNHHHMDDCAKILYTLSCDILNQENVKIILEWNSYGEAILTKLRTLFPSRNCFEDEMIVRFKHTNKARTTSIGLRLKNDNKNLLCQDLKQAIIKNRLILQEEMTIIEARSFGRIGESYRGQMGHDDIVMTSVNASSFFTTVDYADIIEEYYDMLNEDVQEKIEAFIEKIGIKMDSNEFDIYDSLDGSDLDFEDD